MFFSSVESSELYPPMHEGGAPETKRTRRRRKKVKGVEAEGSTATGESKKRKLNDEQVQFLELNFGKEKKLESGRKMHLATELGLDPKQVAVWFQNRRARWKNKQLEEEYLKLKSEHDATVVQKCHLENEVLKLKEMLLEAEEKVKRFSGGIGGGGGGGSSSSSTVETYTSQPSYSCVDGDIVGGFVGVGDGGNPMYIDQLLWDVDNLMW